MGWKVLGERQVYSFQWTGQGKAYRERDICIKIEVDEGLRHGYLRESILSNETGNAKRLKV